MKPSFNVAFAHLCCVVAVVAQGAGKLPNFGDVVNVLGAMERTDQDFQDGLALDLFSPKNRTLTVNQNNKPLAGNFVSGTTGESFIALSNYSYVIKMNETANDLIAKIELPYDLAKINAAGVQECNTFVGKLSADGMSWVIDESRRNVHRSENVTRIVKMVSVDGEFILLGRKSVDVSNVFVQYGQGATRTVNVTGGNGRQQAEFVDGLRFSLVSTESFSMNVDIKNGIAPESLPADKTSLNSFAWVVNTSSVSTTSFNASMRFPINSFMLPQLNNQSSIESLGLAIGRKALNASVSTAFDIMESSSAVFKFSKSDSSISVRQTTSIEGQYVVLVKSQK